MGQLAAEVEHPGLGGLVLHVRAVPLERFGMGDLLRGTGQILARAVGSLVAWKGSLPIMISVRSTSSEIDIV